MLHSPLIVFDAQHLAGSRIDIVAVGTAPLISLKTGRAGAPVVNVSP